ncbi:MAG: GyrI-like domain-containing protein [Phycisphaeraceae bacterium]|nr:GyrI-like domain-containing protein [Phycisphaeraceae bacterium]
MPDAKIDLFKQHADEYAADARQPCLVVVNEGSYLTITSRGAPESETFQDAVGGLYGVAYTIKMTRKFAGKGDYKIAPLEGLWWVDSDQPNITLAPRDQWRWQLLIRTPLEITERDLTQAKDKLRDKKKPPAFEQVKLERGAEGACVQMLHIGPYSEETTTIERMLAFAAAQKRRPHGRHHEIYLSDPRRTKPQKLRTILRIPVK